MERRQTGKMKLHSGEMDRAARAFLERIPHADLGDGYYCNPVMVGPGADNSVVRVGQDFYMIAGGGWPDQLVWHSRDLVNWEPLTRALNTYQGHAWASDIVYHQGRFYIYTTQVDPRRGKSDSLNLARRSMMGTTCNAENDQGFMNIVIWADDPGGPWSEPIDLGVYGLIDPGHIVDEEGNRYLYFNKGMVTRLTPDGLATVGEMRKVYDGWDFPENWIVECKCLEAPKLIFHNGWYYLSSAEGGTAGPSTAHMGIMARARHVMGPWENSPYNPMVRTRSRQEKWWRQGHGTLIDDVQGKWWFLYTGYENGYTVYGKQSLLLPVEWTEDGWPRMVPDVSATDIVPMPAGENVGHGMPLSDHFQEHELGIQWMYDPQLDPTRVFSVGEGTLKMKCSGENAQEATQLSVMPVNHTYEVEVEVFISGEARGGLLLSPGPFFFMAPGREFATVGLKTGECYLDYPGHDYHHPWEGQRAFLQLRNNQYDVTCYHSTDGVKWTPFPKSAEVTNGRRVSLFAAGEGEVQFRNFVYRGLK